LQNREPVAFSIPQFEHRIDAPQKSQLNRLFVALNVG
jgi:hypothetical protein